MYILMCIGCLECGVSSDIVGTFDERAVAEELRQELRNNPETKWRESGQNEYEIFELPSYHNAIAEEFQKLLWGVKT